MSRPDRVVIVGTSVGGVRCGQALRADGFTGDVVVIGPEEVLPYDKPPLSKQMLSGEQSADDIGLLGAGDWSSAGLEPVLGDAAVSLDTASKQVGLESGELIPYDALIVATGARPRQLKPHAHPLMHTVRQLRDAQALREQFTNGGPVVVIGSGFIAAEVASAARGMGLSTTMLQQTDVAFSRVLGVEAGRVVGALHRDHGVTVLTHAELQGIDSIDDTTAVLHLRDGRRLEAGSIVVGIGVDPNTEWLEGSGIALADGVVTDEYCAVPGADGVFAIGDVARWFDVRSEEHRRVEHWTNAVEQASLVAHNLLHPDERRAHRSAPYFWSDQHGKKIQMAGRIGVADRVEILQCQTGSGDRTVALYSDGARFTALVAFGWPRVLPRCRQAWERGAGVAEVRQMICELSTSVTPVPSA